MMVPRRNVTIQAGRGWNGEGGVGSPEMKEGLKFERTASVAAASNSRFAASEASLALVRTCEMVMGTILMRGEKML